MADGLLLKTGGGTDSGECTAVKSQVLEGKTAVTKDSGDEPAVGTMPNKGAWTSRIGVNGKAVIPEGYHNGQGYVDQAITNRGSWTSRIGVNGKAVIPEGYHSGQGYVDQAINNRGAVNYSLPVNGTYAIPEGYHNGQGKVTQSLPVQGGSTTLPGTANKTIVAANRYVSGNIIVSGDPNLKAANIKKNVTIFGIKGTHDGFVAEPFDLYRYGTNVSILEKNQSEGVTFEETYIQIKRGRQSDSSKFANYGKDIDLTHYSKLNFECFLVREIKSTSGTNNLEVSIHYVENGKQFKVSYSANVDKIDGVISIDVSAMSIFWGSTWFFVTNSDTVGYSHISRIWFS